MKHTQRILLFSIMIAISQSIWCHNITVIGIGRLGLCVALCLEKAGHNVLGVDVFPDYIEKIKTKKLDSTEPYVTQFLKESNNFRATTSLKEGLDFSDICFITVSTTIGTDAYNFTPLTDLFKEINTYKIKNKHIILASTVTPGYLRNTASPLLQDCSIELSYNPPFIAQGAIVYGFTNPDMILIGEASQQAGDLLEDIYQHMCTGNPTIARMSVDSAEITKLALNCFVTMKIGYANLVADIADSTPNTDKFAILKALGSDSRIGSKCILPGYGFGGPCFPRDNRGLGEYAKTKNIQPLLFQATDEVNKQHAHFMAQQFIQQNNDVYIFEDISYKPNSPVKIIQESQKLAVAKLVAQAGKKVIIKDIAEAIILVKQIYGDLFTYEILNEKTPSSACYQ